MPVSQRFALAEPRRLHPTPEAQHTTERVNQRIVGGGAKRPGRAKAAGPVGNGSSLSTTGPLQIRTVPIEQARIGQRRIDQRPSLLVALLPGRRLPAFRGHPRWIRMRLREPARISRRIRYPRCVIAIAEIPESPLRSGRTQFSGQ